MKLYLKILRFLKPYWKQVIITTLLTFGYVLFNTLSLWVSVDFIGELFPKTNTESNVFKKQEASQEGVIEKLQNHSSNVPLYQKVKYTIKNILIQDNQYDTLKVICLFIFISFLIKNGFDYFRKVINRYVELKIIISIRNELQRVSLRLPLSYYNEHHTGDLTSIMFNDVKSVQQVLNKSFGKLFMIPLQLLTNIVILFIINWQLALFTFAVVPVSGTLIIKIGASMRRKSRRVFKQISVVLSTFQESISSIQIVKSFTTEDKEIDKFDAANKIFFIRQFRAHKLGAATSPVNEIYAVTIIIALLWYGGQLVYMHQLGADDFIRFLVILFAMFQPLKELSGLNNVLQRGLAAADRIFEILETPQEVYTKEGDRELETFEDSIRLENVSFNYYTDGPAVLKDINLDIKKGETVAFVGHSGSEKPLWSI